jgi:hypothetical protein
MKSRNLVRLLIFVFFLCFVFSWAGWSQSWKIPEKIKKVKYKLSDEDKDWQDLERDLNYKVGKFEDDIENQYFTSEKKKNKAIAQMLSNHDAVLIDSDGNAFSSYDDFIDLFKDHDPDDFDISVTISGGAWIDFDGKARGVEVDIITLIEFEIVFTGVAPVSSDYSQPDTVTLIGEMTSYHRKICTWI